MRTMRTEEYTEECEMTRPEGVVVLWYPDVEFESSDEPFVEDLEEASRMPLASANTCNSLGHTFAQIHQKRVLRKQKNAKSASSGVPQAGQMRKRSLKAILRSEVSAPLRSVARCKELRDVARRLAEIEQVVRSRSGANSKRYKKALRDICDFLDEYDNQEILHKVFLGIITAEQLWERVRRNGDRE